MKTISEVLDFTVEIFKRLESLLIHAALLIALAYHVWVFLRGL